MEPGHVQAHPEYVVAGIAKAMGGHDGSPRGRREGSRTCFPLPGRLLGARMQNAGGP